MEIRGLFAGPAMGSGLGALMAQALVATADDGVGGLLKALRDDKEYLPPPDDVTPGLIYGPGGKPNAGRIVGKLMNTLI